MGEIVVNVEVQNAVDREMVMKGDLLETAVRRAAFDAVVDTGALMLALPEDVVDRLGVSGVSIVDRETVTYADGRRGDLPIAGPMNIHIGDRWTFASCLVIPAGTDPLVGQLVLEGLDLIADCRNQTLGPRLGTADMPVFRL